MKSITIGNRQIGPGQPCFIIAEVGVNHNGDPELAKRMIDAVAEAGVDCVKFQTFSAEEFCNSPEDTYTYKSQGTLVTESMQGMFKRLELSRDKLGGIFEYARKKGLIPLSTPADKQAVDLLVDLQVEAFKVGSDDLVYTPFIEYIAFKKKPIIISSGMANAADIDRAIDVLVGAGNEEIIILHCTSLYPTPEREVNLRRIVTLESMYAYPVGFSDHSEGITAALGAVALGACLIEKHFTLDKNSSGPDHWFSADFVELSALVREVRRLEKNMGSGRIWPSVEERDMANLARRSIVAARDIPAGSQIQEADLAYRRPGTGLLPFDRTKVLGKAPRRTLSRGTLINLLDLE